MGGLEFHVSGLEELDAVTEALAREEHDIPDKVAEAIQRRAEVLAAEARAAVLGEPTHGSKHTGLRADIAANTVVEPTGDGAVIEGKPLGGNRHNLPLDMDNGAWEHPVWGHQNEQVSQGGYYAWFSDTMDQGEDELENAVEHVLDEAIARIAGA